MSYKASIEDAEDEKILMEQLNRHTITRMRRPTRIATEDEINSLPLHMEEERMGPPISIEETKLFMKDDVREGFEATWDMHNAAPPKGHKPVFAKVPLQDWVCDRTEKAGCCELVTPAMEKKYPTTDTILPRLVVEERDGDERLRLIGWTKADNDRLKNSYKPKVPLKHVSAYLSAVHQHAGGKRDALKSYYQAEIPEWARAKQRFKDESGRLWQMTRTSMGHCTMPEVMHTLVATIAGHPDYCKEEHVLRINECDIYIDGIRAADDEAKLKAYFHKVDARAHAVNAQWKAKDSYIGKHYTFDGVDFDHETHKVRISEKLRKKLDNTTTDKLTLAGLESLISRLIHGSAITNTFQPKYYFVMKYARRRIALMNRGISPDTPVEKMPEMIGKQLKHWIRTLVTSPFKTPPIDANRTPPTYVMFTDASPYGWGAVLIHLATGRVFIAGSKWPRNHHYEVNKDEVAAVALATEAFSRHLIPGSVVDLRVDNTSAEAGTNKGHSHSQGVSAELLKFLEAKEKYGVQMKASHVDTRFNYSDPVSRGIEPKWNLFDLRNGIGEQGGLAVFPLS